MARIYTILFAGLLSISATAATWDGLTQVGKAKLEVFFFDVYESTLYTPTGQFPSDEYPLVLNIRYLRDIERDDLLEQTEKEWQGLGVDQSKIDSYLAQLADVWPNVKENDELTFKALDKSSGQFFYNHKPIGEVTSAQFASYFLDIWLHPNSSRPKLRNQLIGGPR